MRSTVRKLIKDYFKKYTIHGLFISILILISQMTALIEPFLLKTVVDKIIPERNIRLLVILAISLILLRIIGALIQYLQKRLSTKIGSNIFSSFVVDFYDHVQRLDLAFFADTKMGEFYQRLGQDIYHIYRMIFNGIVVSFSNILFIMALFVYGLCLSPFLSLIMIVVIPLFIFFQNIAGKMTRHATEDMVKDWSDVGSFQNEKLNSIRLIKELCIEDDMRLEYDRLNRISGKSLRDLEIAQSVGIIFTDFTIFLGPILILLVGIYMHLTGYISLGTVIAFFYFSSRLFTPIGQIVNQQLAYQRAKVGIDRIYEYFDRQPKILENEETKKIPKGSISIEFKNVGFSYKGREPLFKSLNLLVKQEQNTGIVGFSGAGKSTITNLIYRFWDSETGSILVNNVNIKALSLKDLRSRIGMVSQETILLHDTIKSNLKLANEDALDAEINDACRGAGILDFINSLPDGFDTIVGEKGVKLSGGQRQRISIARAILRNPDLLILDEATSHLDSETEKAIQSALIEITKNRTTLIIAHRLSTITQCDNIIVLKDGELIAQGTHTNLLETCEEYKNQWEIQIAG